MSRGKRLSLEEARKQGKLKEFAKEHPSRGNAKLFERLLGKAAKNEAEGRELNKGKSSFP